jgi:hypothetical protein
MSSDFVTIEQSQHAWELGVAREVGDTLERHYPGWMWCVDVPAKQGVVRVKSGFMDMRFGFTLKLVESYSATHLAKEAVRAGGELLERAGMPRSRYTFDREAAAGNRNPRGFLSFQQ